MTERSGLFDQFLNMIGLGDRTSGDDPVQAAGDRNGALSLSREPTADEVERVADDKFDPERKDR